MNNANTFFQTFGFDIKNSLRCNKWLIILCVILFFMGCFFVKNQTRTYAQKVNDIRNYNENDEEYISEKLHTPDYLLFLYRGAPRMSESKISNSSKTDIPAMYIALMILCCCITSRFMTSDICNITVYYSKTRTQWIISKLLCNFIVLFVGLIPGVIISVVYARGTFGYNQDALKNLMSIMQYNANVKDFVCLLLLFILGAYTISVIQICISLAFSYIIGLLTALSIYVFSLFSDKMFFIGNACMIQRSSMFNDGGWNPYIYVYIMLIILLISITVTVLINSKSDYLNN